MARKFSTESVEIFVEGRVGYVDAALVRYGRRPFCRQSRYGKCHRHAMIAPRVDPGAAKMPALNAHPVVGLLHIAAHAAQVMDDTR